MLGVWLGVCAETLGEECPIYQEFDWKRPQNATVKLLGVPQPQRNHHF